MVSWLAGALLVFVIERRLLPDVLFGNRQRDYGIVSSAVGIGLVAMVFWPERSIIAGAFFVVGLADAAAAVVGSRWGRHHIWAWGCQRSFEGSAVFAAVTFAIAFGVLGVESGEFGPRELQLALFIAVAVAGMELVVPSALDNLILLLGTATLLQIGVDQGADVAGRWILAAAVGVGIIPFCTRLRWLDSAGAVGAALVTGLAISLGGWSWILPATVFFVSSSVLSSFHPASPRHTGPRTLAQVLVNGALPVLAPLIVYLVTSESLWIAVSLGAIAAANADTWASEIGRLSPSLPISLRDFRRVMTGNSGAVSMLGLAASVCGGTLIGVVGAVITSQPSLILVGLAAGVVGSLVDSILGAWFQVQFVCGGCDQRVEIPHHCGAPTRRCQGIPGFNGDMVNAVANVSGMAVALVIGSHGG